MKRGDDGAGGRHVTLAVCGALHGARWGAPRTYLTRWRMHLATSLLRDGRLSVREVAERAGYASIAAFSKAFKRRFGAAPALYAHRQTMHGDRRPVTPLSGS